MRSSLHAIVATTVLLLLAACAPQLGYRDAQGVCAGSDPKACATAPILDIKDAALDLPSLAGKRVSYTLSIVEFDDHGVLAKPAQLDNTIDLLKRETEAGDLSIVVYVHGWKHNASEQDGDIASFQNLLGRLDLEEQAGRRRKVVGVYVAWPGALVAGHNAAAEAVNTALTFWTRKEAANRVAEGTIRELFGKIRDIQARRNEGCGRDDQHPCTRLVTIGHSFGALVAYSAVHQHLVDSAVKPDEVPVAGYGDLVILINPAVEGVRYESIQRLVEGREDYPAGQAPVLITFASRGDWANRYFFPLGRYLTLATGREWPSSRAQLDEVLYTIGFVDRFKTHDLAVLPPAPAGATPPTAAARTADFKAAYCARTDKPSQGWEYTFALPNGRRLALRQDRGRSPLNPFWVVSTDAALVPDHSDIWRPDFLEAMYDIYTRFVRADATPCAAPTIDTAGAAKPAGG